MQRRLCGLPLAVLVGWGCANPPPAAAPTESETSEAPAQVSAPAPADEAPAETTGAIESGADDGLDADIAALSASTQPVASTPPRGAVPSAGAAPEAGAPRAEAAPAPEAPPREIVYRVTPQGLVIEIDGIHLRPQAKPFKDKNGTYGIELTVSAESFDGRKYWVNEPGEGPLSIAGKVESKGGKRERFADQRLAGRKPGKDAGGEDELVMEGAPRSFKQRWPGRGQPKLWSGQTVTLEVGLWGVRAESERERPVRRLFEVKMVAGNKPQAVISPPTLDWGS